MNRRRLVISFCILIPIIALAVTYRSNIKCFIYNRKLNLFIEEIDKEYISKLLNNPPPPWMEARIQKDLSWYNHHPISRKKLDSIYKKHLHKNIARFQIRRDHLTYQTPCPNDFRFKSMKYGFEKLTQLYPDLDVDFIVSLEEDMKDSQDPLFVFAKNKHNHHLILIPDFTCFATQTTTHSWNYSLQPKVIKASQEIPWEQKINKCLWRGRLSGTLTDYIASKNIRCKLCLLSKFYPMLIDASFTSLPRIPLHQRRHILTDYSITGFLTPEEHLKYKYLICVDGNTCTYPGLHWRLQSNSLVIKPKSNKIQWYYEGLIPDYHYLLVDQDLANLLPKLKWASHHDKIAKEIAEHASQFASENLSQRAVFHYLILLLKEYQKVLAKPTLATDLAFYEEHFAMSQ